MCTLTNWSRKNLNRSGGETSSSTCDTSSAVARFSASTGDDPRGNYQSLRKSISKYPQTAHLSPKLSEVNHKMDARKKSKASMHETTVSETSSPEDSPLCKLRVPLRTKGRPRKVPHVDSDEAEEQPQGTGKGFRGRTAKLPVKKSNKSKQSDNSDERQSSSKGTRRVPQAQNQELDSDYADSGDNEIRISGPHLKGKDKRGKRSVMCEESSSEESPAVKRKRGELGEWRISRSQPTPKNSKQNNNQALTAKKNGGPQRQNQRQPAQSSIQGTKVQTPNKGNKGQTDKQNSDFSLKGCSPVRMKLIVALEQFEEEVDLGPLHHDLLLHPEGHCSCNELEQLLKRPHQPTCEEPEKRQQPPMDCWMNKQASDEMEGCSWWPQRFQERKPQLEQMMPPELKTWNVDNALMSLERALSLRAKPMLASKAPKCSLPVVEDNFAATTENPASGPSSFINLQQYEDDKNLPSSKFECATDLLGPAVKPFMLELPEKALMAECFKAIWGDAAHCVITPEHFDWYTFQGRAIGIQVDLNCSSFFNGKLVLEGCMKKPMCVDHRANTFFNVLRGRVKITINNREALIAPSQSIMVKSGEVYSIQNVDPQLAVLYFIRIFCD